MTAVLGSYLTRPPRYGIGAAAVPYRFGLPAYIRITDIDEFSRFRPDPLVSVDSPHSSKYLLRDGDLVVARTGASVGKSYRYDPSDGELVFAGFLISVHPDKERLDPRFLEYVLQSKTYWDWIGSESVRSGQPGINAKQIAGFRIRVPELTTQIEVVEKMVDADSLILSLERLIAKKRDIKQGLIQSVLNTGGSPVVPLREVGVAVRGVTYDPDLDLDENRTAHTVELLRANNIQQGSLDLRDVQHVHRRRVRGDQYLRRGDILVCAANGSKPLVGKAAAIDLGHEGRTFGAFMMAYRPSSRSIDPKFVSLWFQTKSYRDWIDVLLAGSSINNLRPSDLLDFRIPLPARKDQECLALQFEDFDREIVALERRLESARAIKQGMMQELLTGRTGLLTEAAA